MLPEKKKFDDTSPNPLNTLKMNFHVQEQFLNKLYITVKKQQKIELTLDQGWYSEAELVELGWKKSGAHFNRNATRKNYPNQ